MDAIEVLLTRKSVRTFTDKAIDKRDIETILHAAMQAPSAYNEQPWQFILIDKRELLDKIADIHPHAKMCKMAPLAILVCKDANLEMTEGLWPQDCSAATQNILLAAHALEIGSVWVGVYPRKDRIEEMKQIFSLPSHITPFSLVVLGYPKEKSLPKSRYNPDRIHNNGF